LLKKLPSSRRLCFNLATMAKIFVMSESLASQVAAGEVVENPAAVVKELVENSIDASATTLRVEIERGGLALLRVSDDGSGMSKDDALLSVERHATSKLLKLEDLNNICQLGFRGEALPSIASVSKFSLKTRQAQDLSGYVLELAAGKFLGAGECGMAPGTCVEVAELFYNTPARRKFLKSPQQEGLLVEKQLRGLALSYPHIRFVFVRDRRVVFDFSSANDWKMRIAQLFGQAHANSLLPLPQYQAEGLQIDGFALPLAQARRNREQQFILLNGRLINDLGVARALREGSVGLPAGFWPGVYLRLQLRPDLVDVNVHPAKREVRFARAWQLQQVLTQLMYQCHTRNLPSGKSRPATPTALNWKPIAGSDGKAQQHNLPQSTEAAALCAIQQQQAEATPASARYQPAAAQAPVACEQKQQSDNFVKSNSEQSPLLQPEKLQTTATYRSDAAKQLPQPVEGAGSSANNDNTPTDSPRSTRPYATKSSTEGSTEDAAMLPANSVATTPAAAAKLPQIISRPQLQGVFNNLSAGAEVATQLPAQAQPLGRVGAYALFADGKGVLLMHVGHACERILAEQMQQKLLQGRHPSEALLLPLLFQLSAAESEILNTHLALLAQLGLEFADLGGGCFQLSSLPQGVQLGSAQHFVFALLDNLAALKPAGEQARMSLVGDICALLVKAGEDRYQSLQAQQQLLQQLLACQQPYVSAVGKPTLKTLDWSMLAALFMEKTS